MTTSPDEEITVALAQIGVIPLEWTKIYFSCRGKEDPGWEAESIIGTFYVRFVDGWRAFLEDGLEWEWGCPENDPRSYHGPGAAQRACQDYLDQKVRSVLRVKEVTAGESI